MDERDLDQELRSFVDHLTDEKVRQGMAPAEARRAALVEFGGLTQAKEEVRDVRRLAWLDVLRQDGRYAFRSLRRNPGFAATVTCTLALAIGANATVFGIVNAVLLRPLPFPEPGRLVSVSSSIRGESQIQSRRPMPSTGGREPRASRISLSFWTAARSMSIR
jgi:hypothetical protein